MFCANNATRLHIFGMNWSPDAWKGHQVIPRQGMHINFGMMLDAEANIYDAYEFTKTAACMSMAYFSDRDSQA